MAEEHPTLPVLRQIQEGIQGTNQRLENVEVQLGGLRTELHETSVRVEDLARRQVDSEMRLATELVSLSKAVGEVRDLLRDRLDDHQRVNELDRRVSVLEAKAV